MLSVLSLSIFRRVGSCTQLSELSYSLIHVHFSLCFISFAGGAGSKGGLGRKCKVEESPIPLHLVCFDDGAWRDGKGKDGDRGDDGKDGTSKIK